MTLLSVALILAWAVLLWGRSWFWRIEPDLPLPEPAAWPSVAVVIPARDEAEGIGQTVRSLLAQDYPGPLSVRVVDDHSGDGTADLARAAANGDPRFGVLTGADLPGGWTGKVWAMDQGVSASEGDYVLFTDGDIAHAPGQLRALVARAVAEGRALVSLMVRLHCETLAERAMIPAFVYFFRMLYPFAEIADPGRRTAGAAGGVMLVERAALAEIGGMAALKDALIDDCTLAAKLKARGKRLWLGLAEETRSLRVYSGWGELWNMIARSAYDQLRRSPALLLGSVAAMGLIFVAAPILAVRGYGAGLLAWGAMAFSFAPMVRFYRLSPWWAAALPAVAVFYLGALLHSAIRYHLGTGGRWKGRIEAGRSAA